MKYHHDKVVHICEFCTKEFKGNLKLKVHIRRYHVEKKPCPLFGKIIKCLWIHKKNMHTNHHDKRYECNQCGNGFVEKGKLEIHMASVHVKSRPFVCRFNCGAASNEKGNRKCFFLGSGASTRLCVPHCAHLEGVIMGTGYCAILYIEGYYAL